MTVIPLTTIAVLERYENYLEQLEYEADAKSKEPKPGEKYYIEPELKAKLEGIELDLREKIRQLHQDLPPSSYAVNLNHQTKKIEIIVETEQLNDEITEIISQYSDVEIVFTNGKFTITDFEQNTLNDENAQLDCLLTEHWNGTKCISVDFENDIEPEQYKTHPGLGLLNQDEQNNTEENKIHDNISGGIENED